MALLSWIVSGVVVAWIMGQITVSVGVDRLREIFVGIIGGAVGGFLLSILPFVTQGMMIYTNLAAVLGAISVVMFARYVQKHAYQAI